MIEAFKSVNTNYKTTGDMILKPNYCKITRNLGTDGQSPFWNLELEHKIDKYGRWKYLIEENKIRAPTPSGKQLFVIYKHEKSNDGNKILVKAKHIFFYSFEKDIIKFNTKDTTEYGLKNVLDKLFLEKGFHHNLTWKNSLFNNYMGESVINFLFNSFDDLYSCVSNTYEIDIDNFNINLIYKSTGIGKDRGFKIYTGNGLKDITETIDYSDLYTRIFATCTVSNDDNDEMIGITQDSPYINNYNHIYEKHIDYSISDPNADSDAEDEEKEYSIDYDYYKEQLREKALREFKNNKIDIPIINYKVNLKDLSRTLYYKQMKYDIMQYLQIGDYVHCYHKGLNITTKNRMISYEFDAVNKKYNNTELGDYIPNFAQILKKKLKG